MYELILSLLFIVIGAILVLTSFRPKIFIIKNIKNVIRLFILIFGLGLILIGLGLIFAGLKILL